MDLQSSWRMFKNLRDQYNLVKSDFERVNQYLLSGRHLDAPQLIVASDIALTKAAADVLNDTGYEALDVFSAMMYGMLTPPMQIWFEMQFEEHIAEESIDPNMKTWMYRSTRVIHKQLHKSNFYSKIQQFFKELGGYCTAALKCIEKDDDPEMAVSFEFIQTGDYLFRKTYDGQLGDFFRIYWKTPLQISEKYPDTCPEILQEKVDNEASDAHDDVALIEHTYLLDEPEEGRTAKSILYYPVTSDKNSAQYYLLKEELHYEMPYYVQRAEENATTEWGSGPGFHAMADILRLQEVERTESFGMHKAVDPPLLASNSLHGRLKTLPGSLTFGDMNPAMKTMVESLYKVPLDLESPFRKIQRLEFQIKRRFYNDVFFSTQRDPNLSPLKAREVDQRDEDKYVRLGPLVTGTYTEMLMPLISRIFNICMRRYRNAELGPVLPPMPSELVMALQQGTWPADYSIELTSPLAKQQNMAALGPIRTLIMTVSEMAGLKPEVLDNFNADKAYREVAGLVGTVPEITNSEDEVGETRRARYEAQTAAAQREAQAAQMEMQIKQNESQAKIAGEMARIQQRGAE